MVIASVLMGLFAPPAIVGVLVVGMAPRPRRRTSPANLTTAAVLPCGQGRRDDIQGAANSHQTSVPRARRGRGQEGGQP